MDAEYLVARIASIQSGLENEINHLEDACSGRVFEEYTIEDLKEAWLNGKRRVEGLDNLVNLLQETVEWIKAND